MLGEASNIKYIIKDIWIPSSSRVGDSLDWFKLAAMDNVLLLKYFDRAIKDNSYAMIEEEMTHNHYFINPEVASKTHVQTIWQYEDKFVPLESFRTIQELVLVLHDILNGMHPLLCSICFVSYIYIYIPNYLLVLRKLFCEFSCIMI
jgi:hypothetical protein